jgi:hypothetical protein
VAAADGSTQQIRGPAGEVRREKQGIGSGDVYPPRGGASGRREVNGVLKSSGRKSFSRCLFQFVAAGGGAASLTWFHQVREVQCSD